MVARPIWYKLKHAGRFGRLPHRVRLTGVKSDGLFTDYMFFACCTLHHWLEMERIARQYQDQIDFRMLDDGLSLVGNQRRPVPAGRLLQPILPTGAQCDDSRHVARLPNLISIGRPKVTSRPDHSNAFSPVQITFAANRNV